MSFARSLLSTVTTRSSQSTKSSHNSSSSSSDIVKRCTFCQGDHALYRCDNFKKLTISNRRDHAMKNKLCFSFLSSAHVVKAYTSKYNCKSCGQRHNTLLHMNKEEGVSSPSTSYQVIVVDSLDVIEIRAQFAGAPQERVRCCWVQP